MEHGRRLRRSLELAPALDRTSASVQSLCEQTRLPSKPDDRRTNSHREFTYGAALRGGELQRSLNESRDWASTFLPSLNVPERNAKCEIHFL